MKKSLLSGLLSAVTFCSVFSFVGCAQQEKPTITLMNGYENYEDLRRTYMHTNIFGKATLCNDAQYVTQGQSSMHLEINGVSDFVSENQYVCMFKYVIADYDSEFGWIDKITEYGMDIYNADEREYTLYFTAMGDAEKSYFVEAVTLTADSWNHIRIQAKPWFFETDTMVKEYRCYLGGIYDTDEKKAELYVDNVTVAIGGDTAMPEIVRNGNDKEILDFNRVGHLDGVLAKNAVANSSFLPHVGVKHNPAIQIGEKAGVLEAVFDRTSGWGEMYYDGNGYDIVVHSSLLNGLNAVKSISIVCKNPDMSEHGVTLIATEGKKTYQQKSYVGAGETKTLTLNVSGSTALDGLTIRIDSWNQARASRLYFADLRYAD